MLRGDSTMRPYKSEEDTCITTEREFFSSDSDYKSPNDEKRKLGITSKSIKRIKRFGRTTINLFFGEPPHTNVIKQTNTTADLAKNIPSHTLMTKLLQNLDLNYDPSNQTRTTVRNKSANCSESKSSQTYPPSNFTNLTKLYLSESDITDIGEGNCPKNTGKMSQTVMNIKKRFLKGKDLDEFCQNVRNMSHNPRKRRIISQCSEKGLRICEASSAQKYELMLEALRTFDFDKRFPNLVASSIKSNSSSEAVYRVEPRTNLLIPKNFVRKKIQEFNRILSERPMSQGSIVTQRGDDVVNRSSNSEYAPVNSVRNKIVYLKNRKKLKSLGECPEMLPKNQGDYNKLDEHPSSEIDDNISHKEFWNSKYLSNQIDKQILAEHERNLIPFPKETRNAILSSMALRKGSTFGREERYFQSYSSNECSSDSSIFSRTLLQKPPKGTIKQQGHSSRKVCWPGVAERVRFDNTSDSGVSNFCKEAK